MQLRSQVIGKIVAIVLFILLSLHVTNAEFFSSAQSLPSTLNLSSPLENNDYLKVFRSYKGDRLFLFQGRGRSNPCYLSGFVCVDDCRGYLFAVVIGYYNEKDDIQNLRVIWSANRNNPVDIGARLELTSGGDIELRYSNGDLTWSSETSGKNSSGSLELTKNGNLVLLDADKSIIWQSFNHPSDTLVVGQKLFAGQNLTSIALDSTVYTLSVTNKDVIAYVDSDPDVGLYFRRPLDKEVKHVELNGSGRGLPYSVINFPQAISAMFMQLLPDGHLKLYEYQISTVTSESGWKEVEDLLGIDECSYPMACGKYRVCKYAKQCSCPAKYFEPISGDQPTQGCSPITQLNCGNSGLMELNNVSYLPMSTVPRRGISIEECKQSCLKDCACKVATYESSGVCSLFYVVYSLMGYNPVNLKPTTVFIKVQSRKTFKHRLIVGISASIFFILVVIIC